MCETYKPVRLRLCASSKCELGHITSSLCTFVVGWLRSLKQTHILYTYTPDGTRASTSTHTLTLTHAHVHTRRRERKLQHNDKVWEHNGLSSAQTEARTSLAPKGQQASPGFHSVPPVIIVQHYNDYSDGLYFANAGAIRKYQRNMKMQA